MTSQPRVRQSLLLFPKLYYFIPCINAHERHVGPTTFLFDEPMDAILWFVELVTSDPRNGACPRPVLKNLIRRWYGEHVDSDFERCYGDLLENKFVVAEQWPEDRRVHMVRLTEQGRQLLGQIKDKRYKDLELLRREVRKLPRREKKLVVRLFDRMSELAWRKMLEDEDPENVFGLYDSSAAAPAKAARKKAAKKSRKSAGKRRR